MRLNGRHNGLHEPERIADSSHISARMDVPLPEQEMNVAQLSTREGGSQLSARKGLELPAGKMSLAQLGTRRRDDNSFPVGDVSKDAMHSVL
jgi:hypothetical protein